MRSVILLTTTLAIVFILYFIYSQGEEKGISKEKIKCDNKQIIIQREIIQDTKQVQKRRVINRSVPTSDNIDWLFNNRCSDCKN